MSTIPLEVEKDTETLPDILCLIEAYVHVRPMLAALCSMTIVPGRPRAALRAFIELMDEVTFDEPPAHTLPIEPKVAME